MGLVLEHAPDELAGAGAGLGRPADDPRRRPLEMPLMCLGPVGGLGCERAFTSAPDVRGDPAVTEQDLDHALGQADIDLLAHVDMGHAVVVALDLDVVVDVDPGLLPGRQLVRPLRKRPERRPVQLLEQRAARARQLLERPLVQQLEEPADLAVQLPQAEERLLAEPGQDPALDDLNARLGLCLVPRLADPGPVARPCRSGSRAPDRSGSRPARSGTPGSRPSPGCPAPPTRARRRSSRTSERAPRSSPAGSASRSPQRT
jgi:hypothetical protein